MSFMTIVAPIFTPNNEMLKRNIASLRSLSFYLQKYPFNCDIVLGGYSYDECFPIIEKEIKSLFGESFYVHRFDKNVGKALVVNTLVNNCVGSECKWMFTMDSDIVFDVNEPNIFNRLKNLISKLEPNTGIIALNQLEGNCHMVNEFTGKRIDDELILGPLIYGGIAGGCWLVNMDMFRKVNGYRVHGVYSGDDAGLLTDCGTVGYRMYLAETINIIHPIEHDKNYAEWKVNSCQNKIDNSIDATNDFWLNKTE